MNSIEEEMRVGALHKLFRRLLVLLVAVGLCVAVRLGHRGKRLGEGVIEVDRLGDDKEQREAGSSSKRVGSDRRNGAQPRAQSGAERECDGEACADQSHGGPPRCAVRDVCRDSGRQLHVALGQAADHTAEQKCSEVGGHDPQQDGKDVARHAGQEGGASAILVGEVSNNGRCDGLEKREQGAEGSAEQNDVIAGVDRSGKGGLVGIQITQDVGEESLGMVVRGVGGGFDVAVEFEELGEEW